MAEQKKPVKHLFGTTEKSDFILNMSTEGAQKLCGVYSIIAVLILTIITIPYYFTQHIEFGSDPDTGREIFLNEKFIFFISTAVLIAGFTGFLFFLVANMKDLIRIKDNKSLIIPLAIIGVTVVSCVASSSVFTTVYGYLDRSEGLLAILGYWGIFCTGMTVTADKWRIKLADFIVAICSAQGVLGILQTTPALKDKIPNYFRGLYLNLGSKAGEGEFLDTDPLTKGVYEDYPVASGFLCSPHALAAVMTVGIAIAAAGVIFCKSAKKRVLYGASILIMSFAAFKTSTVTAVVGVSAAAVIALAVAVAKSDKEHKNWAKGLVCVALAGVTAVGAFVIGDTKFKDENIIFTDSVSRLSITSSNFMEYHAKTVAGQTDDNIYSLLQNDALNVVKNKPILGVGPDNWGELQANGIYLDRCYNEFLDLAAQRGLIITGLTILFMIITLVKGIKAVAAYKNGEESWLITGALIAFIAYIAQAFFNISSNTSSPYFWLAMGLIWSFGKIKKEESNT